MSRENKSSHNKKLWETFNDTCMKEFEKKGLKQKKKKSRIEEETAALQKKEKGDSHLNEKDEAREREREKGDLRKLEACRNKGKLGHK